MQDLGEQLRLARQEKNLSLEEINFQTKIQIRYLEALEKGDPTPFAGEVYFKGALRNYAQAVGLDPDQILREYHQLKEEPLPESQLPDKQARPDPVPRGKRLSFNRLLLLMAAALLVAAVWFAVSSSRELPDPLPGGEVTPAPGEPPAEELPAEEPVNPPTEIPEDQKVPEIIVDPRQSTDAETVYAVSGTEKMEINLSFTSSCWVYLFSDGRELYQRTYKSGEEISAEGSQKIWVRLGNPPAARLTINGVTIEDLQEQDQSHNYLFYMKP